MSLLHSSKNYAISEGVEVQSSRLLRILRFHINLENTSPRASEGCAISTHALAYILIVT